MNVLVTGANGQLGNEMKIVARASADNYIFTDLPELDITDARAVAEFVKTRGIDLTINCAAYTNVEKAETDEAMAEKINSAAVANLGNAMLENNGVLIHVSTDYVFGGEMYNTPRTETDSTAPCGAYGRTKLSGEKALADTGCRHIIIRTAWLYSEFGKNFVKTMIDLTASRPELSVVFDQTGTPTYALDLARTIFHIVETRAYENRNGIYHFTDEGVCSWYDFARMIAGYAGNTDCNIRPCHSSEFPSKVTRPAYSVLDKSKIKRDFGIEIPYWTDSLRECIHNIKHQ